MSSRWLLLFLLGGCTLFERTGARPGEDTGPEDLVEPGEARLTIVKDGDGDGVITSSPGGIECGGDCVADFEEGAMIALSATAIGDAMFAGWSGACSGTGACLVTLDDSKTVTATFAIDEPPGACELASEHPDNDDCTTAIDLTGSASLAGGAEIAGDTTGYASFEPTCFFEPAGAPGGDAAYRFDLAPFEKLIVEVEPATPGMNVVIWEASFVCDQPPDCVTIDSFGPGVAETFVLNNNTSSARTASIFVDSPAGEEGCFTLRAHIE
jgi:hypothetical protein